MLLSLTCCCPGRAATHASTSRLCRVYYKYKIVEWTFELFWPFAVLCVGMFASISALTIVGDD